MSTATAKPLSNTDRLALNFEHCQRENALPCRFMVGRYTGNGPSVVAALRRRGYQVQPAGNSTYEITGHVPVAANV